MTTSPDITRDLISAAVADIAEHRAAIEQAKGMLILLYGLDDDAAFALLRSRSQNANVKLRALADQLVSDFRALSSNGQALPSRSTYDNALMSVHERITGDDRTQASPEVSG